MAHPSPASSEPLRASDLRAALDFVSDLADTIDDAEAFARCGVEQLPRLAASELTTLSLCDLGSHRRHVVDAGRLAEGGVEPHRVRRTLDGLVGQACGAGPGGQPHDRADLVDELERPARPVAEHDEAEGVRAHVDDREAALGG